MNETEIRNRAQRIVDEVEQAIEDRKDNPRGWAGVRTFAREVVPRVEAIGHELKLAGPTKKRMAVFAAAMLVRRAVPWLGWLPDWVLEPLLGIAVEGAVRLLHEAQRQARERLGG